MNSMLRIKPWHILLLLILTNLALAYFIGDDFGIAWDEPSYYLYGERSFDAYLRGLNGQDLIPKRHIFFIDLRYYGPVYTAAGWHIANSIKQIFTNWLYPDIWHFVNYSFFQVSMITLYSVAKRFVNQWAALLTVIIFASQPLLFGHAFINPKDIPFMTFFLIATALGFWMADKITDMKEPASEVEGDIDFRFGLMTALLFFLFIFTIIGKDGIAAIVHRAVSVIYFAPPESLGGKLFLLFADQSQRAPLDDYVKKIISYHFDRKLILAALGLVTGWKMLIERKLNRKGYFKKVFHQASPRLVIAVLLASAALGLATSIRIMAPFAGLLIAGYSLVKAGKRSIPSLLVYSSLAMLISYMTWPLLWDKPLTNFLDAFRVMQDFPYTGEIRFAGGNISEATIPWNYLPLLISIQITESALILAAIGLIHSVWKAVRKQIDAAGIIVIFSWLFAPVLLQIGFRTSVYDNFRQFIFILPPLFILAGLGWEFICSRINHKLILSGIAIIALIPGLAGMVRLHPYEYIYFNSFVGGLQGAGHDFETDYWLTSYREAAVYLKENTPAGSTIFAWGRGDNINVYSREGLIVHDFALEEELINPGGYAVVSTRFDNHILLFPEAEIIYEIKKDGVSLAVIKKLTP